MTRFIRRLFRCAAMVCIVILLGLLVRGEFSANGADFGPTTQRAPGFVPPAEQAPAAGSLAQPAVPLANVTDEQVGAAITRGSIFCSAISTRPNSSRSMAKMATSTTPA